MREKVMKSLWIWAIIFILTSCAAIPKFGCQAPNKVVEKVQYSEDLILRTSKYVELGMVKYRHYFMDQNKMFRAEMTTKNEIIIYGQVPEDAKLVVFKDSVLLNEFVSNEYLGFKALTSNLLLLMSGAKMALVNVDGELLLYRDFSSSHENIFFNGIFGNDLAYSKERNSIFLFNDYTKKGFNLDLCEISLKDFHLSWTGVSAPHGVLNYGYYSLPEICISNNSLFISYPYDSYVYKYEIGDWKKSKICASSTYFEAMAPAIKGWNLTERMDHRFTQPFYSNIYYLPKNNKYIRLYYKRKELFEDCVNQMYRTYGREASVIVFDSNFEQLYEGNLAERVFPSGVFVDSSDLYFLQLSCNNIEYNADKFSYKHVQIQ